MISVVFVLAGTASADQFDDQIGTLQQQASQAQSAANAYQAQASDYQAKVNQLQAQISALQAQINLNQAEYSQVQNEIAANQAKLNQEKIILGENIKELYLESTVSPLEMLASTSNISQFMDEQQYQDKIKNSIQDAMTQVEQLQQTLTGQQRQLTQILANLHGQQTQVSATESQMNSLLALASQNAAAANAQVQADNSQISNLRAQQASHVGTTKYHEWQRQHRFLHIQEPRLWRRLRRRLPQLSLRPKCRFHRRSMGHAEPRVR